MTSDSFIDYCFSGTNDVISFRNLRRDARLVVPCRGGQQPGANYAHLAAFVRTAPRDQVPTAADLPFLLAALDCLFCGLLFSKTFMPAPEVETCLFVLSVGGARKGFLCAAVSSHLVLYCFCVHEPRINTHGGLFGCD